MLVPVNPLRIGTWGGINAGLIVDDTIAHLHIDCTFGNFLSRVPVDDDGHFSVQGVYMLRAFPVQVGPFFSAQFTGEVEGNEIEVMVTVNDTIENRIVVLGPVKVIFGRQPQLGPCPICRTP